MANPKRQPLDLSEPVRPAPAAGAEGGLTRRAKTRKDELSAADRRRSQLPVAKGSASDGLQGNVLRMAGPVWRELREIAAAEETYLQLLIMEGINRVLKDRGRRTFTFEEMRLRPPSQLAEMGFEADPEERLAVAAE